MMSWSLALPTGKRQACLGRPEPQRWSLVVAGRWFDKNKALPSMTGHGPRGRCPVSSGSKGFQMHQASEASHAA